MNNDYDLITELNNKHLISEKPPPTPKIIPIKELLEIYTELKEPIIDGLFRVEEIVNLIAAPKTGKSFLALLIALSIAIGRNIFEFKTRQGKVLILDNELHPETLSTRIPTVCEANGINIEDIQNNVDVDTLRGRLIDIHGLDKYLDQIQPNKYKLIILDAQYRFMPAEANENDNGFMTQLYNMLDHHAKSLGCAFILVHHTSKGSQYSKSITDIGAGAGAQSRAADCHITLTHHNEEKGVVVLNAVCRSFPPINPICLRKNFPVFEVDHDIDPLAPKQSKRQRDSKFNKSKIKPQEFVEMFITEEPLERDLIIANAEENDISRNKAENMIKSALAKEYIFQYQIGKHKKAGFATIPPDNTSDN